MELKKSAYTLSLYVIIMQLIVQLQQLVGYSLAWENA